MKNPLHPCVYIITNVNKTVLYTGVTADLTERLAWHQVPKVSSFTTKYNVRYLIYFEYHNTMRQAIDREKQIKGWSRAKKETLITSFNPQWKFIIDHQNYHSERHKAPKIKACHSEERSDEGPSPLSAAKGHQPSNN